MLWKRSISDANDHGRFENWIKNERKKMMKDDEAQNNDGYQEI